MTGGQHKNEQIICWLAQVLFGRHDFYHFHWNWKYLEPISATSPHIASMFLRYRRNDAMWRLFTNLKYEIMLINRLNRIALKPNGFENVYRTQLHFKLTETFPFILVHHKFHWLECKSIRCENSLARKWARKMRYRSKRHHIRWHISVTCHLMSTENRWEFMAIWTFLGFYIWHRVIWLSNKINFRIGCPFLCHHLQSVRFLLSDIPSVNYILRSYSMMNNCKTAEYCRNLLMFRWHGFITLV